MVEYWATKSDVTSKYKKLERTVERKELSIIISSNSSSGKNRIYDFSNDA